MIKMSANFDSSLRVIAFKRHEAEPKLCCLPWPPFDRHSLQRWEASTSKYFIAVSLSRFRKYLRVSFF